MGLLANKKRRAEAEIPTASMADIALLLLIFFLVTTTIDVDTGIGMTLPPELDETVEPPPIKERNVLKILVNEAGQVLLEDRPSAINQIRKRVVAWRENPNPSQWRVTPETARLLQYWHLHKEVIDSWMKSGSLSGDDSKGEAL